MLIDKDFALKIYRKAMEAANCKAVVTDSIVDDIQDLICALVNAPSLHGALIEAEGTAWLIDPVDPSFFSSYVRTYYNTEMRGRQSNDGSDRAWQKVTEEMRQVFLKHVKEVESLYFRTDKDIGATDGCLLIWNKTRKLAGLSDLRISDLPTFCRACGSYHVSGEDHVSSGPSSK